MRAKSALAVAASLVIGGAAAFVVSATSESVEAASANQVGSINYVKGDATRVAKGTSKKKKLKKDTRVIQGDTLRTGKNARLEARLLDGSMLRLGGNSELKLDNLSFDKGKTVKKVKVKLIVGRVWAAVRSLFGTEAKFEVETATAVAGVRGTRFSAETTAGGDTLVKVYGGKVIVSNEPVYKIKGHTKQNRVEVAGPQEISKDEWTEMVTGAMQMIRVAANGDMGQPENFEVAAAADDDWEAWNSERDKLAGLQDDEQK